MLYVHIPVRAMRGILSVSSTSVCLLNENFVCFFSIVELKKEVATLKTEYSECQEELQAERENYKWASDMVDPLHTYSYLSRYWSNMAIIVYTCIRCVNNNVLKI